jgi:methyl-accepting chemotaxis protein
MGEASPSLASRIGNWFRRSTDKPPGGDGAGESSTVLARIESPDENREPRTSILRPFAKRDQALTNLQEGFETLTDLMSGIKDNLADQGRRQDELLKYLSHLPTALSSIPESHRLQNEALKAISSRLDQQNEQQLMIAEILNRVSQDNGEQKKTVKEVREQLETMAEHERNIADNLSNVGSAMQNVSANTQSSAKVLEQMKDNIETRDGQLERILHKQAVRFTSMLAVAIFLSIAALAAVAIIGYQLLNKPAWPAGPSAPAPAADVRP